MGHSRKHPYLPHGGNWMLTPLPPLDVLIHLLSETFFLPSPSGRQKFPPCGECGSFLERPNIILCIIAAVPIYNLTQVGICGCYAGYLRRKIFIDSNPEPFLAFWHDCRYIHCLYTSIYSHLYVFNLILEIILCSEADLYMIY